VFCVDFDQIGALLRVLPLSFVQNVRTSGRRPIV
jgi:hypothetical protein